MSAYNAVKHVLIIRGNESYQWPDSSCVSLVFWICRLMHWERPTGWDDYLELSEAKATALCIQDHTTLSQGHGYILRKAGWVDVDSRLPGDMLLTDDQFETRNGSVYAPADPRCGAMLMVGLDPRDLWTFTDTKLDKLKTDVTPAAILRHHSQETRNG